jgi:hypothetical protein
MSCNKKDKCMNDAEELPTVSTSDMRARFEEGITRVWKRSPFEGSVCKDLPRLARRITVRSREGTLLAPDAVPEVQPTAQSTFAVITRLVLLLVHELQPETEAAVKTGLAAIAIDMVEDLEMVMPDVIKLLGEDSKAMRVLKLIDQSVSSTLT